MLPNLISLCSTNSFSKRALEAACRDCPPNCHARTKNFVCFQIPCEVASTTSIGRAVAGLLCKARTAAFGRSSCYSTSRGTAKVGRLLPVSLKGAKWGFAAIFARRVQRQFPCPHSTCITGQARHKRGWRYEAVDHGLLHLGPQASH